MLKHIGRLVAALLVVAALNSSAATAASASTLQQTAPLSQSQLTDAYGGEACFGIGSEDCCKELGTLAVIGCMTFNVLACLVASAGAINYC